MNRNIVDTLEEVKQAIPKLWPMGPFLKEKLVRLQLKARLAPRDPNTDAWKKGAEFLSTYLDPVDCDWKRKILIVWLGPERVAKGDIYGLDKIDPGHGGTPWKPGQPV